jgi:DNA repair photolyase
MGKGGPKRGRFLYGVKGVKTIFDFQRTPLKLWGIWPSMPVPLEVSIYGMCSSGCAYCNKSDQPVIMANLLAKPIGDIKAGDRVLGWAKDKKKSFVPTMNAVTDVARRTWCVAEVLDVFRRSVPIMRFIVENGEDVYCTSDHYWFTGRSGDWEFSPLVDQKGKLRKAAVLVHLKLPTVKEEPVTRDFKLGYLRGFAEGDGVWMPQKTWRIVNTDSEPLERFREYLLSEGIEAPQCIPYNGGDSPLTKKEAKSIVFHVGSAANQIINGTDIESVDYFGGWLSGMYDAEGNTPSTCGALRISQSREKHLLTCNRIERALRLLGFAYVPEKEGVRLIGGALAESRLCQIIRPSIERKNNPLIGKTHSGMVEHLKVVGMEPAGEAEVVALKTTTGNYIVSGYLSRNCFANLNRQFKKRVPNLENPVEKLIDKFSRERQKEHSAIGYFLRERYPICFSNTTDPFQQAEKKVRASLAFLKWAAAMDHPICVQTKGGILAEPGEFERYSPYIRHGKDTVYVTITTLDDDLSRKIEPGSPPTSERLRIIEKLKANGVPVSVGLNPYVAEWVPDKAAYCSALANAGVRGMWFEYLHFSKKQAAMLPKEYSRYAELANLAQNYASVFHEIKEWYITARDHGLIFYPDPYIDAWLGYVSPYPDCHSVQDYGPGAKLFTYVYDFMKHVQHVSYDGPAFTGDLEYRTGRKVIVKWSNVEAYLKKAGLENTSLDTNEFWIPFNAKQNADRHAWKAALGTRAPLYRILRHFWNNPHENAQLCWDNPLLQVLKNSENNKWVRDENHDIIGIYNPEIRMQSPIPEACDNKYFTEHQDEFIELGG